MKRQFWKSDAFLGLVLTLLVLGASGTALLQGLERFAYDIGVRGAQATPSERVAVIAIDDDSIANLGRWPWPRDRHAQMIDRLADGGADAIGYTVLFLEPQLDPGLEYIREILGYYEDESIGALPGLIDQPVDSQRAARRLDGLERRLRRAETELDNDARLAESLRNAGNVVLGMPFRLGRPVGKPNQALPSYVRENAIENVAARVDTPPFVGLPAVAGLPPIERLGEPAAGVGHLNFNPDVDGSVRSEALVIDHYGEYYPSVSLLLAARGLNLGVEDIVLDPGRGVRLGGLSIGTDRALQMNTFYYDDRPGGDAPFAVDSFYDVISGRIPATKYAGKIVLVGATAAGIGDAQVTPVSASTAPALTLAHAVSSILEQDFFIQPDWATWARLGAFGVIALYLILVAPRLRGGIAAIVAVLLAAGLVATEYALLATEQLWVPLATPTLLLLIGYTLLMTKRFLATERGKLKSDAESAESNRMLGLSFQSQGQLDTAFEKYRKCPLDESMMEVLYNLALDYERKRQFNKAGNVYDYMASHDPKYRDIETRRQRSKAMEDTVMLGGGGGGSGAAGTLVLEGGGVEKPKLGRYDVEKELGKGAMGVVYQGRDPKINRVVAIKTMALSQEFEADELEDVKQRFFREAETAGRLNHPNIVTIYDAGEEHDLAYIAMEFLSGRDLTPYTKPNQLLEIDKVLTMIADSADALAYAHENNVVHRDIKPGNIMFDADSGKLKITDFGIARITDSSKTKTGMVLGTPSYMSPEQLAGKKVDGRSDLFSLGVMMYQMVSGQLPFTADSMATLMYKIANETQPPIRELRSDLPECVERIIERAMQKEPDARYQDGREMAADIRKCLQTIGGA
ncbi:MAG: serine/threonine-protein kinase [Halofilum sp. (in: g-proteobacteria)]|nr:serine/threonine-protein kinase [Halofilum sp. (in: g-proteobacteria)]